MAIDNQSYEPGCGRDTSKQSCGLQLSHTQAEKVYHCVTNTIPEMPL